MKKILSVLGTITLSVALLAIPTSSAFAGPLAEIIQSLGKALGKKTPGKSPDFGGATTTAGQDVFRTMTGNAIYREICRHQPLLQKGYCPTESRQSELIFTPTTDIYSEHLRNLYKFTPPDLTDITFPTESRRNLH